MARKKSKSSEPTNFRFEFPLDLLAQVLGRLPVKTLLKFRCVSKEWRCLIDSSDFASFHFCLYNNTRQNAPLFLIEGDWRDYWQRCSTRRVDNFRRTRQFDLKKDFGDLKPVGYANGFVLCRKSYNKNKGRVESFVVCNPSTRKSTKIICPWDSDHNLRVVLVCVGESNDDYRLVVIPFDHPSWKRRRSYLEQRIPETAVIQVYSFSTRSWRSCRIDMKCVSDMYDDIFPADVREIVPLNGALHWRGRNPENERCIVAFDVQNEAVRCFALPAVQGIEYAKLSVLHESLVLVKGEGKGFHVWVMDSYGVDGSWVNRVQIDVGREKLFLYLRRNGEFYFSTRIGVNVCDIESRRIKNLAKSYGDRIVFMDTFVETLASLTRGCKEPKKTMQTNYNEHVEEECAKVPEEGQPPPHIMPEGDIEQDKSSTSRGRVQGMGDEVDVMKKKIPQIAAMKQQRHQCDVPYNVRVRVTELNRELSQHAGEAIQQPKEDIRQRFEQLEEQFQQQRQRMEQKLEAQYEQMQQRLEQKLEARFEQMEQKLEALYEQMQQQIQQQFQAQWVQPFMASSSSGGNIGDGALAHRPGGFGGGAFAQTLSGVPPTHLHGPLGGFQQQTASFDLRPHHPMTQPTFVPQQTALPYGEDAFVGYPGELVWRTNTCSQVNEEQADEDGGEKDDNESYVQGDEDKYGEEDDMEP